MRNSVKRFAELMEARLMENDHKGGWENDMPTALLVRMMEETGELAREMVLRQVSSPTQLAREAADVANFAMMIAETSGWPE